jgi:hypothetical protein
MGLFLFTAVFNSGNENMFPLFTTYSSGCPIFWDCWIL